MWSSDSFKQLFHPLTRWEKIHPLLYETAGANIASNVVKMLNDSGARIDYSYNRIKARNGYNVINE